ncbi:MAG: hypothetical protein AB7I01_12355 [Gammaproteobacteria bacterium]
MPSHRPQPQARTTTDSRAARAAEHRAQQRPLRLVAPSNRPTSRPSNASEPTLALALRVFALAFALLVAWSEFRQTHAAIPAEPATPARFDSGGMAGYPSSSSSFAPRLATRGAHS